MEPYDLHAIEIIKNIKYINIASVTSKDMPWNSPVYTAFLAVFINLFLKNLD